MQQGFFSSKCSLSFVVKLAIRRSPMFESRSSLQTGGVWRCYCGKSFDVQVIDNLVYIGDPCTLAQALDGSLNKELMWNLGCKPGWN